MTLRILARVRNVPPDVWVAILAIGFLIVGGEKLHSGLGFLAAGVYLAIDTLKK